VGLQSDLGYVHRRPHVVARGIKKLASTRPGAWAMSKSLAPTDRLVERITKGRVSLTRELTGMPVLMVTTTGRRSGQPRTSPLIATPIGDDLALLGTNFGQPRTPAWVLNLEADPLAEVAYDGVVRRVRARPATDAEAAEVWRRAAAIYGGYQRYQERISGRRVRIFVLEAAG
jgi:deazaflavin-dependent oxidoreductase (nitroreductase family)